jgi:hypothetical protein
MSVDREAIYDGLLAHLKSVLEDRFKTYSRRHIMPPDLAPEQQPALFVVQVREDRKAEPVGTGGVLTLEGALIFYRIDTGSDVAPGKEGKLVATDLHADLKAIDDAFAGDAGGAFERFTIGGLVNNCWIQSVEMDQGIFGKQAAGAITFKVLCP